VKAKNVEKTASLCKEPQLPCPNPVLLRSSLSLSLFLPAVGPCNVAARVKKMAWWEPKFALVDFIRILEVKVMFLKVEARSRAL